MKHFSLTLLLTLLSTASFVQAQKPDPTPSPTPSLSATPTPTKGYLMEEVVVTSDRLPTAKDQVAGSISVLTAKDLERKQRTNVAEALRETLGVDVVQSGGAGKVTSLSLRGSGSERTRVFVDGVEVNDAMSNGGAFDFASLTTDNLERIEVLRGSQSALYGPDATGGVVQVFTHKGQGALRASLTGEMGGRGFLRESLGVSGGDHWFDYSLQVSNTEDKGFSVAAFDPLHLLPLDPDGTKNTVVSSQFGSSPVSFLTFRLIQRYTEAKTDIDNGASDDDPNHRNLTKESILKAEAETSFLEGRWKQTVSFSQSLHRFLDLNDQDLDHPYDLTRSAYHGRRESFEYLSHLKIVPHHTFTLGFENREEWGDATDYAEYYDYWMGTTGSYASAFLQRKARVNGWFFQDQVSYADRFFLSAGARYDQHDLFGSHATWRLAPAYLIPSTHTKLKATVGTGWKTPTLYQRFSMYGNPSLLPERSLSCDAGFEQTFLKERVRLNAIVFETRTKQFLDYDNVLFTFYNASKVRVRGLETSLDARWFRDGRSSLSFHRTDAFNLDTGEKLLRRASTRATFALDSPTFRGARVGFEILYTGKRQDIVFPLDWSPAYQVTLADYTLSRVRADWKPTKRLTFFARVENLFDRRYQEILGYQTAPRTYHVGSRVEF
jgi:vitamin B12 transporter